MDTTHKPSVWSVLITIIVIALMVWLVMVGKNRTPDPTAVPPVSTDEVLSWPSIQTRKEVLRQDNQYYAIEAAYPVTRDARTSTMLKEFVEGQIAQFIEDTSWVMDPSIDSSARGVLSLDISYQETIATRANTYVFTIASYTGGAHGLQATRTYAFNEKGEVITLEKLFTNGAKGLETIAAFVERELIKKNVSDASWIKEGTRPVADNYQNFVIIDNGITFIFDAYQVAPYSAGIQSILVPTSAFKSIANPELFGK
jgi:hypothetical protein